MHAQAVVVRQVMGLPRIAGQAGKALVGRAQGLDHGVSLPRCYEEEADVIGREVNPGRPGLTRGQRFFLAAGFFRLAAFFAALRTAFFLRSEERRLGKGGCSTGRSRWSPCNSQKKKNTKTSN